MTSFGVSFKGYPSVPLRELENGYVVPDAPIAELDRCHRNHFEEIVRVSTEAAEMGYDYLAHAEHHSNFLATNLPSPIVLQTAIARETTDIRLLQMANILPWHEPVRLAEQLAMLDILSDGRIDVGIGKGGGGIATETFGQYWGGTISDPKKNRQSFEEKYRVLVEAWSSHFMSHHGQFHHVPPKHSGWEFKTQQKYYHSSEISEYEPDDLISTTGDTTTLESLAILPSPEQKPHPQLWKPAISPESAKWAARRGINVCTQLTDVDRTKAISDAYFEAAEAAGWPDHDPNEEGIPFQRGWDDNRRRGIGIIVRVFNTDPTDSDTLERWKTGVKHMVTSQQDEEELDFAVADYIDNTPSLIVGDSEYISQKLRRIVDALEFENWFLLIEPNNPGLECDELIDQLRVMIDDVYPQLA